MEMNEIKSNKFRKTEIGLISENWKLVELSEVTNKIGSGITPRGGSRIYKSEGRPFVRSQNIGWGHLKLEDLVFIDDYTHEKFSNTEIKLDDVFLNISGASIGRSAYSKADLLGGNVNQHVCIIRPNNNSLDKIFLSNYLNSNRGQKLINSYQSGGNREGLNIGQIRTFKIPLPPTLEEQKAIATALSEVDALKEKLEALITKKQAIKVGAMQRLLTPPQKGGQRLSGFDGVWEERKLGEIAEINMGQSPLSTNYNNEEIGLPLIQGNADIKNRFTIKRFYTSQITKVAEKGSIIFTVRAPVGKIAISGFKCCIGRGVCSINFKNPYLYHYLLSIEGKWSNLSTGSTFDSINSEELKKTAIYLPIDIQEQKAIAEILSDMDVEIDKLQAKKTKYERIKEGMIQELLTGKTRLV
jgi:type I restriction enzyme S subunit